MRCFSCGSEWKASPRFSEQTVCPFCGISLAAASPDTELTAEQAVKEIFRGYGSDIILQKERFLGLFSDFAPKLVQEKKLLTYALNENIAKFFIKCEESERPDVLKRVRYILSEMMNDASVDKIIGIFTEAFEWDIPENPAPKTKTKKSAKTSEPKTKTAKKTPSKSVPSPKPVPAPPVEKYVTDRKINDFTYTGEVNAKGQPHGKGTAKYSNGLIYDGQWQNGLYHGWGKEIFSGKRGNKQFDNFVLYEGDFLGTKIGKIYKVLSLEGDIYDGIWSALNKGSGTVTYANGEAYSGDWENLKRHGYGTMTYSNGDVYDGYWKADYRNGKGKMTFANGDVYDGEWENDSPFGKGSFKHSGDTFYGEWTSFDKGSGNIYYSASKLSYYGEWEHFKRNGYGKIIYDSNHSYKGNWKDDKYNGYGTETISGKVHDVDGLKKFECTYDGQFKDGKLKTGRVISECGDCRIVYNGEWEEGQLAPRKGKGKITYFYKRPYKSDYEYEWSEGKVYEGEWDDLKPHGQGTMHYPNGKTKTGEWKNGHFCFFKKIFNRS